MLKPILFNETAVPFIDTVELETVALKVAVWPAAGKAAVQLLLLFQDSLAPLPVHAPLRAKAELETEIQQTSSIKRGETFATCFIVREWNFSRFSY